MPDYSILNELCEILGTNVNELLSGERIQNYKENAEKNLISLRKQIDKRKKIITIFSYIVGSIALIMFILNLVFNYNGLDNTLIWSYYSTLINILAILNLIILLLTYK